MASQKQLADKIGRDSSTVVRQLDILEGRGLIVRESGGDRRSRRVKLTLAGIDVVESLDVEISEAEKTFLRSVSDSELEATIQVLSAIELAIVSGV